MIAQWQSDRPGLGLLYQVDGSESPVLRVDPEDRGKGVSDVEARGILFCLREIGIRPSKLEVVDIRVQAVKGWQCLDKMTSRHGNLW